MDLNLINTFLVVVEHKSYTKAAEHLGLTQPAISSAMKRLEQLTNKTLFVKKGRNIELTSTAQYWTPLFRRALTMINDAVVEQATFQVCCTESSFPRLTASPNFSLRCAPAYHPSLLDDLRLHKVDLVVDTHPVKEASFMSESVYKEPVVVICRQGHPRITSDKLSASMFYAEQHCVLVNTDNREINLGWRTNYSAQDLHIGITTLSLSGMVLNVSKSECLGILPLSFAKEWETSLKLQILPCPIDNQLIEHQLIYHRRDEHNVAHQNLRQRIRHDLAQSFNSLY
ncbi:TPA: LysR family transcriptional regulator [Vibrio parahaemolyticus]|nr:LysR family transcriptional regulator [Vibrio parahaemolyticus]